MRCLILLDSLSKALLNVTSYVFENTELKNKVFWGRAITYVVRTYSPTPLFVLSVVQRQWNMFELK